MKIFVLGGTGRFGQLTTRLLARHDLVSGLVIGARNLDVAQRVATELGDKATAVHIDATQEERLTSLVAECDLLLNTSGPYTQTLLPAIRAAMRSRTHYCDLLSTRHKFWYEIQLDFDRIAPRLCIRLMEVSQ